MVRRAAAPTEPVRATASKVSSAGKRLASIIKLSLTLRSESFTGLNGGRAARQPETRGHRLSGRRSVHGSDAARQGLGRAHRPDAAVRPDPALHRPAPHPRGDHAAGLRDAEASSGSRCACPSARSRTLDHIIPTDDAGAALRRSAGRGDGRAHDQATAKDFGMPLFDLDTGEQGIVHVIGPELGLTQPGMTIACGDSHTSTHGAFGAIAFGIGTTPGARRARHAVPGDGQAQAAPGARWTASSARACTPRTSSSTIIQPARREGRRRLRLRVRRAASSSGISMEERMTVCNMSHRGRRALRLRQSRRDDLRLSARAGRTRPRARRWTARRRGGRASPPTPDATFDDVARIDGAGASSRGDLGHQPRAVGAV